jgi:hypothetical protein
LWNVIDYAGVAVESSDVFLAMLSAYFSEFGEAFASADPSSVLKVLKHCSGKRVTTQREIERATGISQSNVAKLIARMVEFGWLDVGNRDPKTSTKAVQLARDGRVVLRRFEAACKGALRAVSKRNAGNGKTPRSASRGKSPVLNPNQRIFNLKDLPME